MKLFRFIDKLLNGITMYRLLLYGLGLLAVVATGLAAAGKLGYPAWAMVAAAAILLAICYGVNKLLAGLWPAAANSESSLITALILFFVMPPATDAKHAAGLAAVAVLAMASKYLLAWRRKHLFNPAAVAAVIVGLAGIIHASWWVATPALLPFAALLGILVLRKIRRMQVFLVFTAASLLTMAAVALQDHHTLNGLVTSAFGSWPLVFMGSIMVTEPSTMPPRFYQQIAYGAIVGALFTSQLSIGSLAMTPELSLVIGNLISYIWSPKYRLVLRLKQRTQLSAHVYDLAFVSERPFHFLPGQYADWTLPHHHVDGRGNRRTFTIASSPTEQEVHIGIKTYEPSSSFKRALLQLEPGAGIVMGQIAGNFILPDDPQRKLAFVAGGIGITPVRSMVKFLQDTQQTRDIILFYLVSSPDELNYQEIFAAADKVGLRLVPVLTSENAPANWNGQVGKLTPELITRLAPDYAQRAFYLSGPQAMVDNYWHMLRRMGVRRIMTDHFSGY